MKRQLSRKQGQVLVEWVIILPVLMILVFGMLQWALIELSQNLTLHAAHNAARAELVNESGYDAAAITLLPVAGWDDTLEGTLSNGTRVTLTSAGSAKQLPGWSGQSLRRSAYIESRLEVTVLENDWDKVSVEITFLNELLFPFVDLFFADVNRQYVDIYGGAPESGQIGMARQTTQGGGFQAKDFIELRARASVPRIDKPREPDRFGLNERSGIQVAGPELFSPQSQVWSP